MSLPGYDAWKLRTPEDDMPPVCARCGEALRRIRGAGWFCDECDPYDPDRARDEAMDRSLDE